MWKTAVAMLLLLAGGCVRSRHSADLSEWRPIANAYADHFKAWSNGDERLVLVFGHGGSTDTVGRYWLTLTDAAHDAPLHAVPLRLPLKRLAMVSTTHVAFVSALGEASSIIAVEHLDQVRDSAVHALARFGAVSEIGTGDGLDREALLALRADALIGYPFGGSEGGTMERLQVPLVQVCEYLEEHPLGRAEWIRFFGLLLDQDARADSLFKDIVQRYDAERSRASGLRSPTVLFGSSWQGQWFVPPGNSCMAELIADAGGRYLFADRVGDGNIALDMETILARAANVDRWGMVAQVDGEPGVQEFTHGDARLMGLAPVRNGMLFIGNTNTADHFGKAMIEPDRLLHDLVHVLHPELTGYERPNAYFTNVIARSDQTGIPSTR